MTVSIALTLIGAALMVWAAWMLSPAAGIGLLGGFLLAIGLFAEFGDET